MAHIVRHYGKSDGTALAERSNSVDGTRQPLLANLQQDRKNADSSFEYGKNMVDFGTKVVKSTKEENNAEKNND